MWDCRMKKTEMVWKVKALLRPADRNVRATVTMEISQLTSLREFGGADGEPERRGNLAAVISKSALSQKAA